MTQDTDALKSRVHESFGQVALALMNVQRYKHLPLGEFDGHLLNPLVRDRVLVAHATGSDGTPSSGMAGVAIWASVSDAVDAKIIEQIKAGVFPIRLEADDWTSGQTHWLFDVVASDPQVIAGIVRKLQTSLPDGELKVHPLINKLLDQSTLEGLGAKSQPT